MASLSAYDRENSQNLAARVEPIESGSWVAAAAVGLVLLLFYSITVQWLPALSWFARGAADAERILHGELWRTVTALTLHADVAHVLSNAVAAAIFSAPYLAWWGWGSVAHSSCLPARAAISPTLFSTTRPTLLSAPRRRYLPRSAYSGASR